MESFLAVEIKVLVNRVHGFGRAGGEKAQLLLGLILRELNIDIAAWLKMRNNLFHQ
jgi:hypothetical protein